MTNRNVARLQLAALAIFLEQTAFNALRAGSTTVRWASVTLAVGFAASLAWKIRQYRHRYPSNV
jgi:hypothetical protein